jgi:hypothetical protein
MKKIMFALLFCFAASTAAAQNFEAVPESAPPDQAPTMSETSGCVDDPRFASIAEIMAGSAPVSPPLTVTPETFLNMDPEVVTALGGQMIICPDNPVLKNGKPMKKITVDFEYVWDKMRRAAMQNDFEAVKNLAQAFVVKAKEPKDIPPLFTVTQMEKQTVEKLYQALGIVFYRDGSTYYPMPADIYIALGGRSTVKAEVYYCNYLASPEQREKFSGSTIIVNVHIGGDAVSQTYKVIGNKLRALGVTPMWLEKSK